MALKAGIKFSFDTHSYFFLSYHQLKDVDKLAIAYKKLFVLRSPLYMAFSYEESQGTQHRILAQVLRSTSSYVNGSTVVLYRMVRNQCSLISNEVI